MNFNSKFVITLIVFFVLVIPILLYLSNDAHPTEIETEVLSLKQDNKAVNKFFSIFDDVVIVPIHFDYYNSTTGESYGGKWRIGLDSQHNGQIHRLDVYYFAWEPFNMIYKCYDFTKNMTKIYSDSNILENMRYNC